MKKASLLLAALMLVSLLAGCGGGKQDSAPPAGGGGNGGAESSGSKTYVIANTPKCVGISWWDRMKVGNDRFVVTTGNEVYQVGPAGH